MPKSRNRQQWECYAMQLLTCKSNWITEIELQTLKGSPNPGFSLFTVYNNDLKGSSCLSTCHHGPKSAAHPNVSNKTQALCLRFRPPVTWALCEGMGHHAGCGAQNACPLLLAQREPLFLLKNPLLLARFVFLTGSQKSLGRSKPRKVITALLWPQTQYQPC